MHKPQVEVLVVVSLVSIVSCLAGSYKPGQTCDQCPGVRIGVGLFEDSACVSTSRCVSVGPMCVLGMVKHAMI